MSDQKHYHQTTIEEQLKLDGYKEAARTQDEQVYEIMRVLRTATPTEVWSKYGHNRCPLTSIRRAMSNLSKAGKLTKTEHTKIGDYGRSEHIWRI